MKPAPAFFILGLSLSASLFGPSLFAEEAKPLRALMITGGCCHDYEHQKELLAEGISARANVEWTIVHEGGNSTQHKVSVYERTDWAEGYDVVVHNECFSNEKDAQWLERIVSEHRKGTPAVVIHCAMHCYRAETEEWFKFVGVTSHRHGRHYPFQVVNLKPESPIMAEFPETWTTPQGELYLISKVWPNATPLAHARSRDTNQDEVCVWTNVYGKARVFGTTIGHHNETMMQPEYLDMVSRGLLWACGKLAEDGRPKKGYEPSSGGAP